MLFFGGKNIPFKIHRLSPKLHLSCVLGFKMWTLVLMWTQTFGLAPQHCLSSVPSGGRSYMYCRVCKKHEPQFAVLGRPLIDL